MKSMLPLLITGSAIFICTNIFGTLGDEGLGDIAHFLLLPLYMIALPLSIAYLLYKMLTTVVSGQITKSAVVFSEKKIVDVKKIFFWYKILGMFFVLAAVAAPSVNSYFFVCPLGDPCTIRVYLIVPILILVYLGLYRHLHLANKAFDTSNK